MAKRIFDILFSLLLLLLLLPLLLILSFLVGLSTPGGVFFRQVRVGMNGTEFRLAKFRTMRLGSEASGQITIGSHDPRITPVGTFLRRTKLDELPQLFNVLVGDMSIVGPRPEVPRYVALYTAEQRTVLSVRPGITGASSLVYFRESELLATSPDPQRAYVDEVIPAKLALEVAYVRNRSFFGDMRIITRTIVRLIGG